VSEERLGMGPHPADPADGHLVQAPGAAQHLVDIVRGRAVAVQRTGEGPIAGERGVRQPGVDEEVVVEAHEVGEREPEVAGPAVDVPPGEPCLQQAEGERGPLDRAVGHAHQQHPGPEPGGPRRLGVVRGRGHRSRRSSARAPRRPRA
jgi:hypothetical protein